MKVEKLVYYLGELVVVEDLFTGFKRSLTQTRSLSLVASHTSVSLACVPPLTQWHYTEPCLLSFCISMYNHRSLTTYLNQALKGNTARDYSQTIT